jgi:hypothetical protein
MAAQTPVQREPAGPSLGYRDDQAIRLLNVLLTVVPPNYAAPDGPGRRIHVASFAERVNGTDVWRYQASAAVSAGAGTGQLIANVYTAGAPTAASACLLVLTYWNVPSQCQPVTVGSAQVGVVTEASGTRPVAQSAGYRFPDGTVAFVAQSVTMAELSTPPLDGLPLEEAQLARLVTDQRLDLA